MYIVRKIINKIKTDILNHGLIRYIDRLKLNTYELSNIDIHLTSGEIFDINKYLNVEEKKLLKKEESIVLPQIKDDIKYLEKLFDDDILTRQGLIYIPKSNDCNLFPCLSVLHFIVTNNKLDLKVFIRSSNVETMLFQDICFLNDIYNKLIKTLDIEKGELFIFISNAHIYMSRAEEYKLKLLTSNSNELSDYCDNMYDKGYKNGHYDGYEQGYLHAKNYF